MKHYLLVTDRLFSNAAGVARGVAPAQVIGNQGISENSPTLKNKPFPIIDLHGQSQEMPLVGDEGLETFGDTEGGATILAAMALSKRPYKTSFAKLYRPHYFSN